MTSRAGAYGKTAQKMVGSGCCCSGRNHVAQGHSWTRQNRNKLDGVPPSRAGRDVPGATWTDGAGIWTRQPDGTLSVLEIKIKQN